MYPKSGQHVYAIFHQQTMREKRNKLRKVLLPSLTLLQEIVTYKARKAHDRFLDKFRYEQILEAMARKHMLSRGRLIWAY